MASEAKSNLNDLLCVVWHKSDSGWKYRIFKGLDYTPCWFVVDGEVHKGEGNGKFFYSQDDESSYSENEIEAFSKRKPDLRPKYT